MILDYDAIVVGLGVAGASLVHALARRGLRTLGLEARAPGHTHGSSHGDSRITRTAVGEGLAYVPLVQRSEAVWAALEARGHALRHPSGVLYLVSPDAGATMHGTPDFLTATKSHRRRRQSPPRTPEQRRNPHPFPELPRRRGHQSPVRTRRRCPPPRSLVSALLAEAPGATHRYHEPMLTLSADGPKAVVDTPAGRYRAPKIYLCLGAWAPAFASGTFARDLRVLRQSFTGSPPTPAGAPPPPGSGSTAQGAEHSFYGFPSLDGRTVKVAAEQYTSTGDPDAIDRSVSAEEAATMHAAHIAGRLPGVSAQVTDARVCLYTHNANPAHPGRFLVAPHPAVRCHRASPPAPATASNAPGLAEALVGQLTGEPAFCDLSAFAA